MGASGSLRFPGNIHNSEAAYSPPLLYLSYESLPRSILFKLTDHSNKFSLFSRHYKYNLEREYSRSRILLIGLFSRSFSSPFSAATKEKFGGKSRRSPLSLSIMSRSISFDRNKNSSDGFSFRSDFISVHLSGKVHFPVAFPIDLARLLTGAAILYGHNENTSITNLFPGL